MQKQITTKYLQSINACQDGIDWVADYKEKETSPQNPNLRN